MKMCYHCKVTKDFNHFYNFPRNDDGLMDQCSDCFDIYLITIGIKPRVKVYDAYTEEIIKEA